MGKGEKNSILSKPSKPKFRAHVSGGCIIRTTKKGVEKSKSDRMKEEDEARRYKRAIGRTRDHITDPRRTESRREKGHKEYSRGRPAESPARKRRRSRSRSSTRRSYKDHHHRSEPTTRVKREHYDQKRETENRSRSRSKSRARGWNMRADKDRHHRRDHDKVKRERRRSRSRF